MNILVLNGSPKGDYSVTKQTAIYLSKIYSEHSFEFLNVGQRIKAFERDFSEALSAVERADAIIFCYPVYTFSVPYQLHRFIELLKDSGVHLRGKLATQITTSKHFYDVTAHKFIQDNCEDLGLDYIRGLSADMEDLQFEKGQSEAKAFFEHFIWCAENRIFEPRLKRVSLESFSQADVPETDESEKTGDVIIITDCADDDFCLQGMIERFRSVFSRKTRVLNIRTLNLKGGCLGCLNCATGGECVYKDGFQELLRNDIQKAEARVFAFSIKEHSMGSYLKLYDDRSFCNGHRSVSMGQPVGYIVNGNYSAEENLRMIMEARASVGENYLCAVATNEEDANKSIDALAKDMEYALDNALKLPQDFYGIGGMKIFRDLIYIMKGFMKEDHKFYKAHGQYDFPQKKKGNMLLMYLVGAALSSPKVKAKMGNKMNEGMLMPYKKVLDDLDKKSK